MISAYVVDDERLAVQRLTRLLQETRRVEVVGSTTDPEHALAFLRDRLVDVLFLDIQMPGLTGFELLEQLDPQPKVIFTTAYDAHALRAFEVNSIDYLLKPIDPERLVRALEKLSRLSPSQAQSKSADIRALARQLRDELPRQCPNVCRLRLRVGRR